MDVSNLHPVSECKQKLSRMSLWIIEYIWVHKRTDIQEVLDPSCCPEMDSEPLTLGDSCRLRVASAQIYSIVKNRQINQFERVMGFLETTYGLLPRLLPCIKHMKIMFGLKTMVVMWMLREGRGMVETLLKINLFFPSKLPQYQDQCSPHKMFLMRKNHLDFKALAQGLVMDKDKLDDYVMNHMEEQYGAHYALKVEDRLLHYLNQLEAALPGDTYIDRLLRKNDPETEEEKLLLEVFTSDSATIATTLKQLLCCGGDSSHPWDVSQSSRHGNNGIETSQYDQQPNTSKSHHATVDAKTPPQIQRDAFRGGDEDNQTLSKHCSLLLDNAEYSDVGGRKEMEVDEKEDMSSGSVCRSTSSQFCSKHQRWVKSILQECPDERSEELQLKSTFTLSPLRFQSSSSATSSQDLTPSGLIPAPPDQPGPSLQTTNHLQTAAQVCVQAKSQGGLSSGSPGADDTSQIQSQPRPSLPRHNLRPTLMLPVVRLVDIASVGSVHPSFKPPHTSPNHTTMSSYKQAASPSKSQARTPLQGPSCESDAILCGVLEHIAICRQESTQPLNPLNATHQALSSPCVEIPQNPQIRVTSFQSKTPPCTVTTPTCHSSHASLRSETDGVNRTQMKLSESSQAMLLQSKLLQPCVRLTRLSGRTCYQVTNGRCSTRSGEPVVQGSNHDGVRKRTKGEEEDANSSFDVNILYSSYSSSTDIEESLDRDPDYKPRIKKKRLVLNYEWAEPDSLMTTGV